MFDLSDSERRANFSALRADFSKIRAFFSNLREICSAPRATYTRRPSFLPETPNSEAETPRAMPRASGAGGETNDVRDGSTPRKFCRRRRVVQHRPFFR